MNSQFLSAYPHYVLPNINWNESVNLPKCPLEESEGSFVYSCTLPVPMMPVHVLAAQHDPVLALVKEKLQWKYDVKLHTDYLIKAKKENKDLSRALNHQQLTLLNSLVRDAVTSAISDLVKHLAKLLKGAKKKRTTSFQPREKEFVELFANNPDEHFDGVYNWYYTGGCISKLELNGTTVIALSQGKRMDQVCAYSLKNGKKWQLGSNIFMVGSPASNSPIFELCCKSVYGKGNIGIRARNVCCIYSMTSLRRIEPLHRTVSSYPFTSLDISKYLEGRYCTVTTERELNVWNAESDSQIFSMTVPMLQNNLPDKWNCIRWSNSRCLVMADRYYIQMVDVRKKDIIDLLSPRKDSHLLHECEMITLILPSAVSSTAVYVTTSHQVLLYDTRKSSKPLQQWTHLLRAPPLYGSPISIENGKEAACFANQQLGEINMILNSHGEKQSFTEQPVISIPNMKDAMRAAHRNGLWLDPACQQRLNLSCTGMTWLPPHKSKLTLLTINSAGDVFSQVLKLKEEDKDSLNDEHCGSFSEGIMINNYSVRDMKCLKNWEKHTIKKKPHFILKATRRIKMKHVFKSLKNSSFVLNKSEDYDTDNEYASQWKMSKAQMLQYKDVMAPVLLQTWEIDENEWHADRDRSPEAVPENTPTTTQKVEAWLNMSLQSSLDLSKNINILNNGVRKRRDRTIIPKSAESCEIGEFINSFSEAQNQTISPHQSVDLKCIQMPSSASASMMHRTPDVCSRIFAPSTLCTKHNMLSQDTFPTQLFSSRSQTENLLSSQNTILSTSKTKTVKKNKHISGF